VAPTATSRPSTEAAIWMFIPVWPALPENRSGMPHQSHVGQIVPSTSTLPEPVTSFGSGTTSASASPMAGRSRSQRRDTVGWPTPKTAPANSWVMFVRINATTIATDRNNLAYGRPARGNHHRPRGEPAQPAW
jgi:hypothetical protein